MALLDILGFRATLLRLGSAKLAEVYREALARVRNEHEAEHPVEITQSMVSLIDLSERVIAKDTGVRKAFRYLEQPVVFSDSLMIFSIDDSRDSLVEIANYSNIVFQVFLKHSLPIRGAISAGDCVIDFDSSLFIGEAIVNAFEIERELDIVGIVVDPDVVTGSFDHQRLSVSTKGGCKEYLIPKFNPEGYAGIDTFVMWARFDECREGAPPETQQRYLQSEEVLSIMVSGEPGAYQSYCELLELGRELQEKRIL